MPVLKWYDGKEWIPVSYERLDRRKNLADLTNVAAARTNLGLVGNNVTTHYHDDRYYTKADMSDPNKSVDIVIQPDAIVENPLKQFVTEEQIKDFETKIDEATVSSTKPTVDRNGNELYNGFIWYNPSTDTTMIYLNGQFRDVGAGKVSYGIGNYTGNGGETKIAHGLKIAPVGVTANPTANPNGFLGETWVRTDSTYIYVGNTGSYTGQFRYSIVYKT